MFSGDEHEAVSHGARDAVAAAVEIGRAVFERERAVLAENEGGRTAAVEIERVSRAEAAHEFGEVAQIQPDGIPRLPAVRNDKNEVAVFPKPHRRARVAAFAEGVGSAVTDIVQLSVLQEKPPAAHRLLQILPDPAQLFIGADDDLSALCNAEKPVPLFPVAARRAQVLAVADKHAFRNVAAVCAEKSAVAGE